MSIVIVDVREPTEFAQSHIKGSINLPLSTLLRGESSVSNIPKDSEVVLYCRSGNRSGVALEYLKKLVYMNLVNGINQDHVSKTYGLDIE